MDHVRPIDLRSFTRNGLEWVVGRSGGILDLRVCSAAGARKDLAIAGRESLPG
jgi:hypothetical protein